RSPPPNDQTAFSGRRRSRPAPRPRLRYGDRSAAVLRMPPPAPPRFPAVDTDSLHSWVASPAFRNGCTNDSNTSHLHWCQQQRSGGNVAAPVHVDPAALDAGKHLPQISRNSKLLQRLLYDSVLNPETSRAPRVIPGHQIDALPHHL